jgi:hypothetical protein
LRTPDIAVVDLPKGEANVNQAGLGWGGEAARLIIPFGVLET